MIKPSSEEGQGPQKERETKDDGRYIIFYTFEDGVAREAETRYGSEGAS